MTAKQFVVVSCSFGTGLLTIVLASLIAAALLCQPAMERTPVLHPPRIGPPSLLKQSFDEIKYGPVNKSAQQEVKDGLISRIREMRSRRLEQRCEPQNTVAQNVVIRCPPRDVVSLDGCTVGTPVFVSEPVLYVPKKPVEYPAMSPALSPIDLFFEDCDTCAKKDPKSEAKTGSFVCSRCKKPCVGDEWHTYWQPDGSPLTFLCESCHQSLSPAGRQSVYSQYMKRQSKSVGDLQSLHPELSQ